MRKHWSMCSASAALSLLRLVRVSPLCPSCRLVTAAKFVEFGNHLIAQPCRKLGIQHDGIANRRGLLRPLDGRAMVNPPLIGIEPAIGRRRGAMGRRAPSEPDDFVCGVGATRSGASRSSSPAMPTSVNKA